MATSPRAFKIGLYREHLEDSGFLYEQRLQLLHDPQVAWRDVGSFEDRLEAHIDALLIGEDLALEVCRKRAKEAEAGELFAIIGVFCRQRKADYLSEILAGLDFDDPQKVRAVGDALKHELPEEWTSYCERALPQCREGLARVLATVAGHRRLPLESQVSLALSAAPTGALSALLWARGRLARTADQNDLLRCLRHDNIAIKAAALLALLRLGVSEPLARCHAIVREETWPLTALGLGGSRAESQVLADVARSSRATPEGMLALGLLGELSAVRVLHDCLAKPDLAPSAAGALDLITGAKLYEDVFVPEEIVEDELFDKELRAWKEHGQAPTHPDGRPLGTVENKLTQDPEKWRAWLSAHSKQFDANHRYRNGKLYSPGTLLENLADDRSSYQLRQLAAEEIAIRYGCDVPFEADMPVARQLGALRDIESWINAHTGFQPGGWYFSGRPI
jgi:uncharacterized protein (TIGR02270 family)